MLEIDVKNTSRTAEDVSGADERTTARKRLEKRRGWQGAWLAYVVINTFLVIVWALTGGGYFWPAWIIGGWGVGMLLGMWDYVCGPVTESDIARELRRHRR